MYSSDKSGRPVELGREAATASLSAEVSEFIQFEF